MACGGPHRRGEGGLKTAIGWRSGEKAGCTIEAGTLNAQSRSVDCCPARLAAGMACASKHGVESLESKNNLRYSVGNPQRDWAETARESGGRVGTREDAGWGQGCVKIDGCSRYLPKCSSNLFQSPNRPQQRHRMNPRAINGAVLCSLRGSRSAFKGRRRNTGKDNRIQLFVSFLYSGSL